MKMLMWAMGKYLKISMSSIEIEQMMLFQNIFKQSIFLYFLGKIMHPQNMCSIRWESNLHLSSKNSKLYKLIPNI
jgi:hypothetical protein